MNATAPVGLDWDAIYCEYKSRIYRYILRHTNDQWLAEDLTADTFVKAIDSVRRGQGYVTSFSGWLYRVAHNLVIDHYRARDLRRHLAIDDVLHVPDPHDGPARLAEQTEARETVHKSVQRLTHEQAHVILRCLDGYDYAEIAQEMGKSYAATKELYRRGRQALESYLNPAGAETERRTQGVLTRARIKERKLSPHATRAKQILLEHGPMIASQLALQLNTSQQVTNKMLRANSGTFAVVTSLPSARRHAMGWGLVGIHEQQAPR